MFFVKASIIYILSRFVYLLVAGIMNRKIGIDQALEYILQPGSDLERSKLSDSESDEEPTVQPPSRIQDDEIEALM